jgi:4-amino-4-deoxy-L-arabinose transferase-like glycosyltransferase
MDELRETGKFKAWIKNPYNLALIAILLFAFGIRIYYLNLSSNQALWWDEAEYGSAAKHIASGAPEWIGSGRGPLYPLAASVFYLLGLGEIGVKFFQIILATLIVLITYLLVKKLYDKKTAILTAGLSAVFWTTIFWSIRLGTDFQAFFFQLLTILFFFNYLDDEKPKSLILSAVFFIIAFFTRTQSFLIVAVLFLLFLAVKGKVILQNKKILLSGIVLIAGFVLFILTIGKSLFIKPNLDFPIAWNAFSFISSFLNPILLIVSFLGLIAFLINIVISFDLIKTSKESKSDFFLLLILIIWFGFFVFYIRAAEDRWLLMTSLPIFIIVSKGMILIYNFIRKYSKFIAIAAIILLMAAGSYFEIMQADGIIKSKRDSYSQVKEAGVWIKDNSNKGDIIFDVSAPQNTYYSERETVNYAGWNITEFEDKVQELKPRFLVASQFEVHPDWTNDWMQTNNESKPVKVLYDIKEKEKPVLVIYEFNK